MGIYDWLYKTATRYNYPTLEEEPNPLAVWGEEPDTGALAVPPAVPLTRYKDAPVTVSKVRSKEKTPLGKALLEVLPRALEAGIAGAATPNIAGGGPTDIFRAMQAGRQAIDVRDANRIAMQRQAEAEQRLRQDQLIQQANADALRQMYGAHTNLYNAQAEAAQRQDPTKLELFRQIRAQFPNMPDDQAWAIVTNAPWQPKAAADPHKDMTYITPDSPYSMFAIGTPDEQGGVWMHNNVLQAQIQANRPQSDPMIPVHFAQSTDAQGNVSASVAPGRIPAGGEVPKPTVFNMGKIGTPQKPAGTGANRGPRPQDYAALEGKMLDDIQKLEAEARKQMKEAQEDLAKAQVPVKLAQPRAGVDQARVDRVNEDKIRQQKAAADAAQKRIQTIQSDLFRAKGQVEESYKKQRAILDRGAAAAQQQPQTAPSKPRPRWQQGAVE